MMESEFSFGFILRAILRGHSTRLGQVKEEPEANGNGTLKREDPGTNGNGRSHGRPNEKSSSLKVNHAKKENSDEEDLDSEADSIDKDESIADEGLDTLCLALGILTNLIQVDEEVKNTLRETCACPSIEPKSPPADVRFQISLRNAPSPKSRVSTPANARSSSRRSRLWRALTRSSSPPRRRRTSSRSRSRSPPTRA